MIDESQLQPKYYIVSYVWRRRGGELHYENAAVEGDVIAWFLDTKTKNEEEPGIEMHLLFCNEISLEQYLASEGNL